MAHANVVVEYWSYKYRIENEHIQGNLLVGLTGENQGMSLEMVRARTQKTRNKPYTMYQSLHVQGTRKRKGPAKTLNEVMRKYMKDCRDGL